MSSSVVGGTCPSGGTWYACSSGTYFVGCCARDPCTVACAAGSLYPAGFDPSSFEKFPDASCGTGSLFYTCTSGNTFLGCCKSNACLAGSVCPRSDLDLSFLYRDDQRAAYGAAGNSSSVSSSTTSSTLSTTASIGSATATKGAIETPPNKNGPPVGAIAGGAVGGAVALAAILGLVIYYCCHAKKSRKKQEETGDHRSDLPAMVVAHEPTKGTYPHDAPPGYASPNLGHPAVYQSYAHQYPQQYSPVPQELSVEPQSPMMSFRKPVVSRERHASELSGDTAIRSELESPYTTPKGHRQFTSKTSSPTVQHSGDDSIRSEQNSPAHDSPRPAQGLGLHGAHTDEENAR